MNFLASETHFIDHLAPVWHAFPASIRGEFIVMAPGPTQTGQETWIEAMRRHAAMRGIEAVSGRSSVAHVLVASYGDIKQARRLHASSIAFLEHGIGQSYAGRVGPASWHASYAGGADRDDISLFLVPNEHSANRWRQAYPDARVEVVGSPRLDDLPAREPGPGPVIALSFHWETFGVVRFAPEISGAFSHYRSALPELARTYKVLGHGHPRNIETLARPYRSAGIKVVRDFVDVCRQADIYVCDNSSTLYEFASTGRPVVVLNAPFYRRNVNHGLRFWDAANVGLQVDDPADLLSTIRRARLDPPEVRRERERALSIVYGLRTDGATSAAAAVTEWSREAVAA